MVAKKTTTKKVVTKKNLPKAQDGKTVKPTADSTLFYHNKVRDEFVKQAEAVRNTRNTGTSLDDVHKSKPFVESKKRQEAAQANQIRQKFKGKPGFDKNGFPIKKSTTKKK
jgi:hypothetical protein